MTLAEIIPLVIKASIVMMVFALGLQANHRDATFVFVHPGLLLRSIFSMSIVMPIFVVAIVALFDLDPAVKLALVALSVSPVPPILPQKQTKAGGQASYAVGLLFSAAIIAIVLVPLTIEGLSDLFDRDAHMPLSRVAPIMFVSVIAPLVAGIAVHSLAPEISRKIRRPLSIAAAILLVASALPVLFKEWPELSVLIGNGTIIVLALFTLVGAAVGHALGGPDPDHRTVLALATGTRHPGLAIAIANIDPLADKGALAVVIWHLVVGAIVSIPYVRWRIRRHAMATKGTAE